MLAPFEACAIRSGGVLGGKWPDANAIPRASPRHMSFGYVGFVISRAQLRGELIGLCLGAEGADLQLVSTFAPLWCGRISRHRNLRRFTGRFGERIARAREDGGSFENVTRRNRHHRKAVGRWWWALEVQRGTRER